MRFYKTANLCISFLFTALISATATSVTCCSQDSAVASNTKQARTDARHGDAGAVVAKAIPYLIKEGQSWIDQKGCVSCHQIPAMLWSLSAASDSGFDIDRDQLTEWFEWSLKPVNFVKPAQKKDFNLADTLAGNTDTLAALVVTLGQYDSHQRPNGWNEQVITSLLSGRTADATWKPCGQLPAQKRPLPETTAATTAWTLISLLKLQANESRAANKAVGDVDFAASIRAIDAINQSDSKAVSTEWFATRILVEQQLGTEKTSGYDFSHQRLRQLQADLIGHQNDDGGWGWLVGESSDALGTGMALYALAITRNGDSGDSRQHGSSDPAGKGSNREPQPAAIDVAIEAARRALTSTQTDAGSWQVPGTKKSSQKRFTPTSNYWGTAWSVIALLESSPK